MEENSPDMRCALVDIDAVEHGITEADAQIFHRITSISLSPEQEARIIEPPRSFPQQEHVLAVHWHPEFVPFELIRQRLDNLYPNRESELIIPTQHNTLMSWDGYSGVEVDCYSHGFKRKVQLLLHFRQDRVREAHRFQEMLRHTFRYRSSQLMDILNSITAPGTEERRQQAVAATNTEPEIVEFCRILGMKLMKLLEENWDSTPEQMVKNNLVRHFFDGMRPQFGNNAINQAQVYLKAVKKIVKRRFPLKYFYRTSEMIEEAKLHGAGVVIPHPEQFWPILLADYDVDGIEVWNPQSREYTEFLIGAVDRRNQRLGDSDRPVLIFMGDDCHMSEKVKAPALQDPAKAGREIGLQPAWDDLAIRKSLILCGVNRPKLIAEYKARLDG